MAQGLRGDDLDAHAAAIAARGLEPDERETFQTAYSKLRCHGRLRAGVASPLPGHRARLYLGVRDRRVPVSVD
jgi:hypothetical protein